MKVILSRKGFDSDNGGCASPILPDGTLLSMPIPVENDCDKYSELQFCGKEYSNILNEINPRGTYSNCHLDPDIRPDIRAKTISNWIPAFGQCAGSLTHLENRGVCEGDLFLFFGWFRECERNASGSLSYKKGAPDLNVIYGYMQIGSILKGDNIQKYVPWHSHAQTKYPGNNAVFTATNRLTICGEKTDFPGYGVFSYQKELCLTKEGMSRSRWDVPKWFCDAEISFHNKNSIKNEYFQSAGRGQELVIQDNSDAENWAKAIIKNGL